MAVTLKASKEGLEMVDRARRKRGWAKADGEWCQVSQTAPASLKRFWRGMLIRRDTFIAICQAVGMDWQEIADLSEIEEKPDNPRVAKSTQLLLTKSLSAKTIYQNLPAREYNTFVGRQVELNRLMELLSYQHSAHLISVDGIGGVGKTTLVLEAAYQCLSTSNSVDISANISTFEAIIFTSAKQNYLTSAGPLQRLKRDSQLRDIFRAIANTLDRRDITHADPKDQLERTRESLSRQRTLLIVDNLESIEDKDNVLSFLYDLPATVKVVITTRDRALFVPIRLNSLPETDSLQLIENQSLEKGVILSPAEAKELYQITSGIPAAIVYAIGQLAAGYILKDVIAKITQATGDVAHFCFQSSVTPLTGKPAHLILMALAMFSQAATREAIAFVALPNADPIATSDGLARLQQLSLVAQREGYYDMIPLTRRYAIAQLAAYPEFESEARERWINWYQKFTQESSCNWKEWHIGNGNLEGEWSNIQAVLEWCIAQNRYSDFREIWPHIKGYIHVRGYWDDRLTWSNWLIQEAEQRCDWFALAEAMLERSKTLSLMGQPKQLQEADLLLTKAWELINKSQQTEGNLKSAANFSLKFDLGISLAVLRIRQQKFTESQTWLEQQKNLLTQAELAEEKQRYFRIHIFYYQAEICYKSGNYLEAKALYEQALSLAESVGWLRSIIYSQHWLADVEIALGNLTTAQKLLEDGLPVSERYKDQRCTACYQRSLAKLEQLRGNLQESRHWAELALHGFDNLGMKPEVEEMQKFWQSII
ncbi:NB-ARC domain-containing protein [Aerosakkonemataceae cyanobacterium BLCC-F154]|uniref:NB-ARC domain-containing protein n=1 Tax=Floridaenema fluviatile BLCC-F154 TaxID=3153640 RepID=A0ABV4YID8_9CYAN